MSSYCSKLQLKTSGTKGELIERLAPLKDESLFDKRVSQITKKYKFRTSLSRENVPPPTAGWKFDTALFPKIKQENKDITDHILHNKVFVEWHYDEHCNF